MTINKSKFNKTDTVKKIQASKEVDIQVFEPVTKATLTDFLNLIKKILADCSYASIVVIKNK